VLAVSRNDAPSMTAHLLATLGLYGGTLVVCFVSALVPIVNAEIFLALVAAELVTSPAQLPAIVVCAAVGQMTAKVLLYYAGMGLLELPRGRYKGRIERARARIATWRRRPYVVFAISSTVGLPPFYLVSIVAGSMKIGFRAFCAIGLVGRTLRFAVVVAIPAKLIIHAITAAISMS
jgi:membrane protein YqaA with SNARE-associated domain